MFESSLRRTLPVVALLALPALSQDVAAVAAATPAAATASSAAPALGWRHQFAGILNISQAYFDNWAKGGTDAWSWDLNLAGGLALEQQYWLWENTAKIVYGRTKLEDLASRKSLDEWRLETIYSYKTGTWINPFVSAAVWSQFTAGYIYDDATDTRELSSEFFDPGYLTQTVGVGVSPFQDFRERLGFAIKETFSGEHGYADDPETDGEIEDFKAEFGLSSVTDYQFTLMDNVLAATKLDVFVNFKGVDEIDGRWENKITAKVNKLISLNLELELLYDKELSETRQLRENIAVGITFLTL